VILAMNPLSAHDWPAAMGPLALFVVMFTDTALLVGLFLPGDCCCSPPGCSPPEAARPERT
jgi:membrane protein DedA with SNARE-associated domain